MRTRWIETVIDVKSMEPFQSYDAIKLLQHSIQITYDIVSGIAHMTRIHADADLILLLHAVDDGTQFFKPASHLAAFSRHGFQQNDRALLWTNDLVEQLADQLDPLLYALSHMASRMKIVIVSRHIFHPLHIIFHGK